MVCRISPGAFVRRSGFRSIEGATEAEGCFHKPTLDKRGRIVRNDAMITGLPRGVFCAMCWSAAAGLCLRAARGNGSSGGLANIRDFRKRSCCLRQARRLDDDSDAAAVFRLRAAEIAWGELSGRNGLVKKVESLPADQQQALRILARSAEELAPLFVGRDRERERKFQLMRDSATESRPRAMPPRVSMLPRGWSRCDRLVRSRAS